VLLVPQDQLVQQDHKVLSFLHLLLHQQMFFGLILMNLVMQLFLLVELLAKH